MAREGVLPSSGRHAMLARPEQRGLPMVKNSEDQFNQPVSGMVTPRFGGIATFMRLPHVPLDEAKGIDIGLVGIPWDAGTTNRPGPRHGPRQIRDSSAMIRRMHQTTGVVPYDTANCADLGD